VICDDDDPCSGVAEGADLSQGDGSCAYYDDALLVQVEIYRVLGHGWDIIPVGGSRAKVNKIKVQKLKK